MHIHVVPNRGSPPTVLLRESYRQGSKVGKRTLANLSSLSAAQIEAIRATLRGEALQRVAQSFEIAASRSHGHVQAVALALQRLRLASLLAAKPCRERDLVLAMVASRIVAPHTKLATTRWWHTTTLAEDFGVADASEDDLYAAMDWLLARQDRVQKKLATRHLSAGGLVLYDLSSSYFEGSCCPLAKLGYSRDGRRGLLQVNYGLLTDARGCPVAVSVYEGNVADSQTLLPEVQRLRKDFGVQQLVLVGDRGMVSNQAIAELRESDGVAWITALKSVSIRALVEQGHSCATLAARPPPDPKRRPSRFSPRPTRSNSARSSCSSRSGCRQESERLLQAKCLSTKANSPGAWWNFGLVDRRCVALV